MSVVGFLITIVSAPIIFFVTVFTFLEIFKKNQHSTSKTPSDIFSTGLPFPDDDYISYSRRELLKNSNNFSKTDFWSRLHQRFSTTVFLYSYGVDYRQFDNSDFVILEKGDFKEFNFLTENEIHETIKNHASRTIGFIFTFLHKKYEIMYYDWLNTNHFRYSDFDDWLIASSSDRRENFDKIFSLIDKNPNHPIEFLVELI